MRTFIAIKLDEKIIENASALLDELRKSSRDVKWVDRKAMHITLKFLGEIKEEDVARVKKILEAVCGKFKPFDLEFKGTGFFPANRKNARVFWVGTAERPELMNLQEELEKALEEIGFPREERKFHPHLTLGRVKIPSQLQGVFSTLEKNQERVFGKMAVRKITFFQSVLKPSGPEYSILSEYELK